MCRIKNRYVSSVTCLATSNKNSKRGIATKIGTNPEDTGTTVQVAHISINRYLHMKAESVGKILVLEAL